MQFVNKDDDAACGGLNFFQHGFQALFKFTAEFRACHHRSQVQRHQALVAQGFGHVTGNDTLGQALDNRGLTDTRFPDQYGVVFGAAGQDLNGAADFFVTPDHGIQFPIPRHLCQVARIFLKRVIFALCGG